jgi:HK97 family phage portal protein
MSLLERIVNWGSPVERQLDETASDYPWSTSAFTSQLNEFLVGLTPAAFSPRMAERVWAANRCIQLNSQQISQMPLRFFGTREPAWVSNPDPVWFPNGIGDVVAAIVRDMYGWGDAFLYMTSSYADGFPAGFTVLGAEKITVEVREGRKLYRHGQSELDTARVVQITRDPKAGNLRGTPALRSFASQVLGLTAAADTGNVMNQRGMPPAVIKSKRKLIEGQAELIQQRWVERTALRSGAPAVLGPDLDFETVSFSPADLLLLESQEFDAKAICAAFGVPASFLNMSIDGGLTYQSPQMLGEHLWRFELSTIAGFIQRAMSSVMLPRGSWVEFDAKEALKPTYKDMIDALAAALEAGMISAEEARLIAFNLPPQAPEESIVDLSTPPSAGASPAEQTAAVVELRPTTQGSS